MRMAPIEKARPNLNNLLAALHEVQYTGQQYYEFNGKLEFLQSEAADAENAINKFLEESPEIKRFLGAVFLAREERLAEDRRFRNQQRR